MFCKTFLQKVIRGSSVHRLIMCARWSSDSAASLAHASLPVLSACLCINKLVTPLLKKEQMRCVILLRKTQSFVSELICQATILKSKIHRQKQLKEPVTRKSAS